MTPERQIKFRVWDTKRKIMSPGKDFVEWLKVMDYLRQIPQKEWKWMQYTGLKDKNGKEIYEGDILITGGSKTWIEIGGECSRYKQYQGIIGWDKKIGSFHFTNNTKHDLYWPPERSEVIGNIYENPELLKGESE